MNPVSPHPLSTSTALTTIVTLDIEHPVTRAVVADGHMAHRLTMSGFAHLLPRHDFFSGIRGGHPDHRRALNVLFATSARMDGTLVLRIQSDDAPDFTHASCDYWRSAIVDSAPPVTREWPIPVGGDIRYQIRANPTVTSRGRRHAVNGSSQRMEWWMGKASAAGLRLRPEAIVIDDHLTIEFPSKYARGTHAGWVIPTQRYSGAATIVDPAAYLTAVRSGIGRGLAYGAGLLLTTRLR